MVDRTLFQYPVKMAKSFQFNFLWWMEIHYNIFWGRPYDIIDWIAQISEKSYSSTEATGNCGLTKNETIGVQSSWSVKYAQLKQVWKYFSEL